MKAYLHNSRETYLVVFVHHICLIARLFLPCAALHVTRAFIKRRENFQQKKMLTMR